MKRMNRAKKGVYFFSIFFLMALTISVAFAADEPYPNRPINVIINMAPGSLMDNHARILGERLAEILGQPLLRIHKPGGGGSLAASFVAKSKPDGYTLLTGTSTINVLIPLVKKVDYTIDDLYPLGIYARAPHYLYVKADAKWKTFQEFIEDARARPGELKIASYGKQTYGDFVIEDLNKKAGIKLVQLPTKGCAESMSAILGGHVDASVCTSSVGQADAGTVRLLALSDERRSELYPNVKTFKEWGYPVSFFGLFSLCAPGKTPQPILNKLSNAMQEVFRRHGQQIREELMRLENVAFFCDPAQSIQEFKKSYEQAYRVAKEIGYIQ
jgi:tripartite-type tricarboxylate transporter receptor subunit TctC